MVAQRTVDDIRAQRVGIFHGCGPVVFFGQTLRLLVLAAHEHVGGLRSRTYIIMWNPGRQHREHHRAVLHLLKHVARPGHHKVGTPGYLDLVQGGYAVGVHEAPVEHGYHLALASETGGVQPAAVEVVYLLAGAAVFVGCGTVPLVKLLVKRRAHALVHRVGGGEHLGHPHHERQLLEPGQLLLRRHAHEQCVVPLAPAHHIEPPFPHSLHIDGRHRKVGRVDHQPLPPAPFHRARREKLLRPCQRERAALLVGKVDTIEPAVLSPRATGPPPR